MTIESGILTPRPYARLYIMLGNQLIKNNTIALTELAKNSYDADASWVQIRIGNIKNYGKAGLKEDEKPYVEIEDDGDGMSFEIIRDSWMNPASPNKYKKRLEHKVRTRRGRVIQGEKGIGRYAVFQIGKKVEMFSRERKDENEFGKEIQLITDLSIYDDELLSQKTPLMPEEGLYLDQVNSQYFIRDDPIFIKPGTVKIEGQTETRKNHGTLIRITELNYKWTLSNVKSIRKILAKLQSPFRQKDFAVSILYEGEEIVAYENFKLEDVLEEALLDMEGSVGDNGVCEYHLNGKKGNIDLVENLKQDFVKENRQHFFDDDYNRVHNPQCGPFNFKFYVYEIDKIRESNKDLANYIRDHRTYIYRDDIRIYPYGDQDNDWLKIDTYRGTIKAGLYLSNDQLIGYIIITSEGNPELRDKTSREGLVEQGTAYEDLRLLTLSILNFLQIEFRKARLKPEKPKHYKARQSKLYLEAEKVEKSIENLNKYLDTSKDLEGKKLVKKIYEDYANEKRVSKRQIEIVEDLAGVGIAVDATSHDVMVVMNRAVEKINEVTSMLVSTDVDLERLQDKIEALNGQIMFMRSLLVGIQPLFRSSRRLKKALRVSDIVQTVKRYYETSIKKIHIQVNINESRAPLFIDSSEGVLLQLFINLMDNSVYWLNVSGTKEPKIEVLIDGEKGYVIFSDNGPGVRKEDIDYLFEPFFSTKGLEGRGLGLYIARQLTDKYEYDLYYLEKKEEQILPGANFRIDFFEQAE